MPEQKPENPRPAQSVNPPTVSAEEKSANAFVAVSDVQHGDKDGNVKTFPRGEEVKGLSPEAMLELWEAGALAVKGTAEDPNNWPVEAVGFNATTPRVVEDLLRQQVAEKEGPRGEVVTQSQPGDDVPKDPKKLLVAPAASKVAKAEDQEGIQPSPIG